MKIGIISDIHGNIEALNSVFEALKEEKCEKIFCLGDLAMAGPEPNRAIDAVKNFINTTDFILIQGNTDFMLSEFSPEIYSKLLSLNKVMANAYENDCFVITQENKDFLKNLSKQKEIVINGLKILLVHGSPRRQDENIMPDLPLEKVEEMISGTDAGIIFCGHTHLPCGYQTKTKQTVVNVGSVGRPFSLYPESCCAVLDVNSDSSFEIRHKLVKYDYMSASRKLSERSFDGADKLAQMLIKATSRYPE